VEEEETTHPVLTKLAVGHRMLQIEIDAIEFPMAITTRTGEGDKPSEHSGVMDVDTHITKLANRHVA
jgi:hypothetical protein